MQLHAYTHTVSVYHMHTDIHSCTAIINNLDVKDIKLAIAEYYEWQKFGKTTFSLPIMIYLWTALNIL